MNIKENVSIHNRFLIEVRDEKTGEITKIGKAENIVLDNWGFKQKPGVILLGSGTDPSQEKPSMKNLIQKFGEVNISETSREVQNGYLIVSYKSNQVQAGDHVGKVFAEVGLRESFWNSDALSHAFIKDSEGNPLTITKKDTDVITLYATVYIKLNDLFKTKRIDLDPWFATGQDLKMDSCNSRSNNNLEINEQRRKKGYFRIENDQCNGKEIRMISIGGGGDGSIHESKKIFLFPQSGLFEGTQITKEKITGEKNGVNKNFNLKWNNGKNVKIYKNNQLLQENIDYKINCSVKKGNTLLKSLSSVETNSEAVFEEDYINGRSYVAHIAYKNIFVQMLKSDGGGGCRLNEFHVKNLSSYIVNFEKPQKVDSFKMDLSTSNAYAPRDGEYQKMEIALFDSGEWKVIYTGSASSISKRNLTQSMTSVTKARVKMIEPKTNSEWKKVPWLFLYQDTIDMITCTNPPLSDDVLEADYFVDYLAKDENHVINIHFDATLSPGAGE